MMIDFGTEQGTRMELEKVKLVYFSPTGTTRTVLENIASGIGIEQVDHIDLTPGDAVEKENGEFKNELVIIGAPVYAGRLPAVAVERLKKLKADKTPAVIVVVYGNRAFEDALLELKDVVQEVGFIPVAGGAFIGEHSFATDEVLIANGRPDIQDIETARTFGVKIKNWTSDLSLDKGINLSVPGNFPYKAITPSSPKSPSTIEDTCDKCGICASVCPTNAISINGNVSTNAELCIFCCACIKKCPTGARVNQVPAMVEIAERLSKNFSERRYPEIFMIQAA
jgi:ferredoxin